MLRHQPEGPGLRYDELFQPLCVRLEASAEQHDTEGVETRTGKQFTATVALRFRR